VIELDLQLATEAGDLPAEAQLRRWVELALRPMRPCCCASSMTKKAACSIANTGTRTTPPTC